MTLTLTHREWTVDHSDWMNMSDAHTGKILWQDDAWDDLLHERDTTTYVTNAPRTLSREATRTRRK